MTDDLDITPIVVSKTPPSSVGSINVDTSSKEGLKRLIGQQQEQIDYLMQVTRDQTKQLELLKSKRLYQMDYTPGSVKNRALGEPNSYVFSGLSANKPTTGVKLTSTGLGCSIYWAYDTHILYIWDGTQWRTVTLS